MKLSKTILFQNDLQQHYFGYSAFEIYTDYRAYVDQQLKYLLIELSKVYEELHKTRDMKSHLLEVYHTFWKLAESPMQKFHMELQSIFRVPFCAVFPDLASAEKVYSKEDIQALRKDIDMLEDDLLKKKCYLEHMKMLRKQVVPLKQWVNTATTSLQELDAQHIRLQSLETKVHKTLQELQKYDYPKIDRNKESQVMEEFWRMVGE
ncbi:uncharacterized protein LOC132702026 [Cylas formicarius]|uniref:uncharacterized protein LOC132702026 n=1 Tax=Cylas formicarius TaxID=197179 RepID=UPI002958D5C0|nr:uncharacterized protein LOC132702026 [Cylas formicarius]